MNVEAKFSGITLPHDVQVGEEFTVTARARVVHMREDLVDVRRMGAVEPEYITGGVEVELLISGARFDRESK